MGKGYRQGRLGEEIRKIISAMLISGIKDPRLSGMISVTAVDVTSDGSYATVYVSSLMTGTEEEIQNEKTQVLEAFKSAKGLIRKQIGHDIRLRHVPDLIFQFDNSLEYGRHISEIIDGLHNNKEEE